jgi:glycosyltransferase involved in cell wall biosynthesis
LSALRILHTVELYDPSVGGAQAVVGQVSRRLAARGHEVTVATRALAERTAAEIDGVRIAEFPITGNAVRGMKGPVREFQDYVVRGEFDVVMGYAAQQWSVDALLPVLDDIPYAKTLAPCGFSALHDPSYARYFDELPRALARFDRLIFHSGTYQDVRFARDHGLENVVVVPNAADEREFADHEAGEAAGRAFRERHGIAPDAPLLLTVGGHTGEKGHALAIETLRRLDKRAVLVIAGNKPLRGGCLWDCRRRRLLTRRRVLLLDAPRAETVAAFHAADVFLFASGIECSPLVLFESAAAGTPFVSLDVGNSAEIAQWTGAGRIAPTQRLANSRVTGRAEDLAREVDALLADPAARRALGEAGREAWRRSYTWEDAADRYETVYREAIASLAARS